MTSTQELIGIHKDSAHKELVELFVHIPQTTYTGTTYAITLSSVKNSIDNKSLKQVADSLFTSKIRYGLLKALVLKVLDETTSTTTTSVLGAQQKLVLIFNVT